MKQVVGANSSNFACISYLGGQPVCSSPPVLREADGQKSWAGRQYNQHAGLLWVNGMNWAVGSSVVGHL